MKEKLENGFLIVPKEILTLTKVNNKPFGFAEKNVYSYLLQWSKTSEKVFPSMKKMCLDLGVGSRTSMTKYLSKLEDVGLLRITKVKGKSSHYVVLDLEGKNLSKPKEASLIRGTNEPRRESKLKESLPVVIEPMYIAPDPTSPWDFEFDEEIPPF